MHFKKKVIGLNSDGYPDLYVMDFVNFLQPLTFTYFMNGFKYWKQKKLRHLVLQKVFTTQEYHFY